jgi:hypothetical protein
MTGGEEMRAGLKRAMILSGAAHAAAKAVALAGTLAAAGAVLASPQPAPLAQLPPSGGGRRRALSLQRRSGLATAARALARGETWRRSEQIVARARPWQALEPAEPTGVPWTVSNSAEPMTTGPVLWGIESTRAGAVVAFFPTREQAEMALREVRTEHPGLAGGSRRVVRVDLGLAPTDTFRPDRAAAMDSLPPLVVATSPGPNPFYLMQG